MHTVELLEYALDAAERLGFKIRQDWLGGSGGGACQFKGQKWIFLDLALNPDEQFDQVAEAIQSDPAIHTLPIAPELRAMLKLRKTA